MCSARSAISALILSSIHCALVRASFSIVSLKPLSLRTWLTCVRNLLRASSSLEVSKLSRFSFCPNVLAKLSFSFLALVLKRSVVFIFCRIQNDVVFMSERSQRLCLLFSSKSSIFAFTVPCPQHICTIIILGCNCSIMTGG